MNPKDLYLVLYNLLCSAGWALIWFHAVRTVVVGLSAPAPPSPEGVLEAFAAVYGPQMETMLWYTQGAALLEIVHALLRLVRSPVLVTAMQVMSRIVALVAVVYAPTAQGA
jgi:very-long-chain (3R)-3-hydroxyacyl-CoA dehydratase